MPEAKSVPADHCDLKAVEAVRAVKDVCREHEIHSVTVQLRCA
jgi:hypothetical protein